MAYFNPSAYTHRPFFESHKSQPQKFDPDLDVRRIMDKEQKSLLAYNVMKKQRQLQGGERQIGGGGERQIGGGGTSLIIGKRGKEYYDFIKNILVNDGTVSREQANAMLENEEIIGLFNACVTHKSVDSYNSYELLEFRGDKVSDFAYAKYIFHRFPKILNIGVKRSLKIAVKSVNYIRSKAFLSVAAEKMGFRQFVSVSAEFNNDDSMRPILEDVFEAFMGACDLAVLKFTGEDVGFIICYEIIKSIFDKMDISLKYEDIVDPVTRLKELADPREGVDGEPDKPAYPLVYIKNRDQYYVGKLTFTAKNSQGQTKQYQLEEQNISKGVTISKLQIQFFNWMTRNPGISVSNMKMNVTDNIELGQSGAFQTRVRIQIEDKVFEATGKGYDDASAKKDAATNLLKILKENGYEEFIKWDNSVVQ